MRFGDISNKVSPRILLVFEGALGLCTDTHKLDKALAKGKVMTAVKLFELNQLALHVLDYLYWKKDINIEVVTFLGEEFAEELAALLDERSVPVHRVWSSTPDALARRIAYMPDLAVVYDPEPARWLAYGAKGRYLQDVRQIGEGL